MTQRLALFMSLMFIMSACAHTQQAPNPCKNPRPQICTMEYTPVCGFMNDGTKKTFSNACSACSDEKVDGFKHEACSDKD